MSNEKITLLCDETKRIMITQLIGLGESQRRIYEKFFNQPEASNKTLRESYEHHCLCLESLIKYQKEHNGN